MTPDVNVLVAASRSDHPHHDVAIEWLTEGLAALARGGSLTLMPMVLTSYIRLVTSARVFAQPTPIETALKFAEALLAIPGVQLASCGPEWPVMRKLCGDLQLSANDIPDAWLAAATIHLGEHLVSFDRDFKKLLGQKQFTLLAA